MAVVNGGRDADASQPLGHKQQLCHCLCPVYSHWWPQLLLSSSSAMVVVVVGGGKQVSPKKTTVSSSKFTNKKKKNLHLGPKQWFVCHLGPFVPLWGPMVVVVAGSVCK